MDWRKVLGYVGVGLVFLVIGWGLRSFYNPAKPNSDPVSIIKPRPLEKYSIENLSKAEIKPAKLTLDIHNKFVMEFEPGLDGNIKRVSGRVSFPVDGKRTHPIIIMIRGYVDKEIYESGTGTKRAADKFTENGYVTFAPDFLGYGESDPESENVLESRFQTYVTVISLIKAIEKDFNERMATEFTGQIFLWGHSNGGQIALTTLEITGGEYPTVLWAPVSKPFPYSILYYTDELSDLGKYLRRQIAKFEEDYDPDLYSIHNYFDRIGKASSGDVKVPIQLHQGTADSAVPRAWSDALSKTLKDNNIPIDYFVYPGADHNLAPAWNTVVNRNLSFYTKHTK